MGKNLNKVTFLDVLVEYYHFLDIIKYSDQFKKDKSDKQDIIRDRLRINSGWLRFMQHNYFLGKDRKKLYRVYRSDKILNKKCFRLKEDERCVGCEDGKPYKVIKYRNILLPIYIDDYGQQDFTIINDKTICGGAYNLESDLYFISKVDDMLEKQFMNDEYDMRKEILDLYQKERGEK